MSDNFNLNTNRIFSISNLRLQVMSPVALKENPLSIKLSGPKQFKTWYIRLKQHLIRHSTEWSEYASTGNISSVIEEYSMSKQASNTAIQLLSSALIDLIKLSTEGEANNLVYNISDTNELQSGKNLLDTIINTYQMSNVRYNSDIWTPLLDNANKPLEDKIKYANDLASKIFEPNEFDKEFMNNCSPAILLKYKENINSKKNDFIGYFLLALCPDSQKHCLSFMGNLTKMNHVELISRLKEADDNTTPDIYCIM